jgi:hypothetical protein
MKKITKCIAGVMLIIGSTSSQAMTLWAVESGQGPFSSSQGALTLFSGTTALDIYYDVGGDVSYGYDLILGIDGTGSIANVDGVDLDEGAIFGTGWRQLGGSIYGETGSSVLAFSFDFTADAGTSLLISGSYTDSNFDDATISSSTLASVSAVPVPAAVWLFGSGLLGLIGVSRKRKV